MSVRSGEVQHYSIIADEVTDTTANREVLGLCIRYVTVTPDIRELFLHLRHLERTTGQSSLVYNASSRGEGPSLQVRSQTFTLWEYSETREDKMWLGGQLYRMHHPSRLSPSHVHAQNWQNPLINFQTVLRPANYCKLRGLLRNLWLTCR